jgi:Flp pilus assembly protein TadG
MLDKKGQAMAWIGKCFIEDRRGNVLMMFGLAVVPLIGFVGGAIDFSIASQRRQTLQIALDAATLVVAREPAATVPDDAALAARITAIMAAQLPAAALKSWQVTSAKDQGGRVTATVEGAVETPFLGLVSVSSIQVAASSEVARPLSLEVALVLDSTGSMATNNRIGALRTAATTLIDTLYASPDAPQRVRVALVPFVTTVNIKVPGVFNWSWIDQNAFAKYHGANFKKNADGTNANHLTLYNQLGVTWKGCVEARAEPYDTSDAVPNGGNPDTLFVPWFWPDEPDPKDSAGKTISYSGGTAYNNNYMPDDYTKPANIDMKETAAERQRGTSKYTTKKSQATIDDLPSDTSGPNKSCPEPLTPLTNDPNLMRSRIAAMMPWNNSGTNIAQGMVWGWNVLSPEEPFTEGTAYGDQTVQKAMIVLTDGENEVFGGWNTHNKSDYSSYGFLSLNRLGTTDKAAGVAKVNEKVAALCNSVKGKNIRVYTITFQLSSTNGQKLFRECATKPEMYFNSPSTSDLQGIFKAIATDLGALRFSK